MTPPLQALADLIVTHGRNRLPPPIHHAARRTLYNVLATSVGASRATAVRIAVAALRPPAPPQSAEDTRSSVPGRAEPLTPSHAALVTGIAAHLDDFDDTHLRTVIHPGAVCLAALVALRERRADADAEQVLRAYAWGLEAQLRLGVAVTPQHYDAGWHITGTVGPVGAATTAGLLLGLSPGELATALEWALEAAVGQREGFGSMAKPFHPGAAASSGLRAALDAAHGAPGPGDTLCGPDGFLARLCGGRLDLAALLDAPGQRWELAANTFKPYPCGIVSHPAIEAAEALAPWLSEHGGPDQITTITLQCHPLVPELTGHRQPADGLQARFSTAHGIAAGLLAPPVDLTGYTTELVQSAPARRLRDLVVFHEHPDQARDAAVLSVSMTDGAVGVHRIKHARGSTSRPLTDAELAAKARGLIDPVLGPGAADRIDNATRTPGPGYLPTVLDACSPTPARAGRTHTSEPTSVADPTDDTLDHRIARRLAAAEAIPIDQAIARVLTHARRAGAPSTDPEHGQAAAAIATALVAAGTPAALAAAAATACHRPDAESAVATALEITHDIARQLAVPADQLTILAATLAAAHGLPPARALTALGLAATRTTAVHGPTPAREVTAQRVRYALTATSEIIALARAGFSGPTHPLTGRRGLLTVSPTPAPRPSASG